METYEELLRKKADIEQKLADARKRDINEVVVKIREWIGIYNLEAKDLFPAKAGRRPGKVGGKVEPKYRNPSTGDTWTGRGKAPKWIQGQDRTKFLI